MQRNRNSVRTRNIDGRTFYCVMSYGNGKLAKICADKCKICGFRVRKVTTSYKGYQGYPKKQYDIFVSPTPESRELVNNVPRVPIEIIGGLKSGGDTRTYPGKTLTWESIKLKLK